MNENRKAAREGSLFLLGIESFSLFLVYDFKSKSIFLDIEASIVRIRVAGFAI